MDIHARTSSSVACIDKPFRCFALSSGGQVTVHQPTERLVIVTTGDQTITLDCDRTGGPTLTARRPLPRGDVGLRMALAAFEALLSTEPHARRLILRGDGWLPQWEALTQHGILVGDEILAEALFQHASLWMGEHPVSPARWTRTGDIDHPARPLTPQGRLYSRFIPWLKGSLSFDVATTRDAAILHRWMNDPRVAEFWKEDGPFEHQFDYLRRVIDDPHMIPLICRFDEAAFGYFEIYWAKEDLIGRHYAADDYDRGFHVLIGEDGYRGKAWLTAWMTSILHLMFLSDPRTDRLVGEPQADHHQQIRNLLRSGFTHVSTVDFPTKRAAIVHLERQHYFTEGLWKPRTADGDRGRS